MSTTHEHHDNAGPWQLVVDEYSETATYIHDSTGLRVECSQPVDLWHIIVRPPVEMGDSGLARVGFAETQDEAEEKAKRYLRNNLDGVPDTWPLQRGYTR